ncbi:MAG: hypothetical protein IT532_00190 [Burkholderiales bacterium]|nr:hypothetical protein [Burkholderiales bacterium]
MLKRFVVWDPDGGRGEEDGREFNALDAQAAVAAWADWDDDANSDYRIVCGEVVTVQVRDLQTNESSKWVVSGEAVISYTAVKYEEK